MSTALVILALALTERVQVCIC